LGIKAADNNEMRHSMSAGAKSHTKLGKKKAGEEGLYLVQKTKTSRANAIDHQSGRIFEGTVLPWEGGGGEKSECNLKGSRGRRKTAVWRIPEVESTRVGKEDMRESEPKLVTFRLWHRAPLQIRS